MQWNYNARIIEKNSYFLVRLKDNVYKKKKEVKITSNDSPIKLELTSDRLKKFHNGKCKKFCGIVQFINNILLSYKY